MNLMNLDMTAEAAERRLRNADTVWSERNKERKRAIVRNSDQLRMFQ